MPPKALAQNGINVRQGWSILERRQSLFTNHVLNEFVRFLLYVWMENHHKDKVHYHTRCLGMVSVELIAHRFLPTVSVPAVRETMLSV